MTRELRIARGLTFPVEAITETFGILARKSRGKTYAASVMAEEMVKLGQQIVVIDPLGVWWGLRSKYPILIFGGDHADLPLQPAAGELIADLVVNKGVSVILDFSKFESKAEEIRFVTAFATKLYRTNRKPLHIFLDEADYYAPESSSRQKEENRMLGAFINIVRRGRARGLGITMITQRSASISKQVLTQIGCLITLGMTAPTDRKAIELWVKAHDVEHEAAEMMRSLAGLQVGQAWVWWPELEIFKLVQIRKRETFDSSATPKVGVKVSAPKQLAPVDLEKLRDKLQDTIDEAEANDPKLLRAKVKELERKLSHPSTTVETKEIEVPILDQKLVSRLEQNIRTMQTAGTHLILKGEDLKSTARELESSLAAAKGNVAALTTGASSQAPSRKAAGRKPEPSPSGQYSDEPIVKGARRILETLGRHYPMWVTKPQLATLSGFKQSGTFSTYLALLTRTGMMVSENKQYQISKRGMDFIGIEESSPQSPQETLEMWMRALVAGERRLLEALIEFYPSSLEKQSLAEEAGFSGVSGTVATYLATLKRNGLITVEGGLVRASALITEGLSA